MAEFLHEITKKRDEQARIDTLINNQDPWTNEDAPMSAWERSLIASYLPPAGEEPF